MATIRRLRDWIGDEAFMVTYSDGLGNVDIARLIEFHRSHGKLATVTAVQPPARFEYGTGRGRSGRGLHRKSPPL